MRAAARRGRVAGLLAIALSSVAVGAAFPAVLRIPRKNAGVTAPPPATFSHRTHQTFGCYACHPTVFPQAPVGFTHAEMREGKFCSRCHDSHGSFAIENAQCARCHVDGR